MRSKRSHRFWLAPSAGFLLLIAGCGEEIKEAAPPPPAPPVPEARRRRPMLEARRQERPETQHRWSMRDELKRSLPEERDELELPPMIAERRLPGRSFLVGDDWEGFGLYSYILFRNPPDEDKAAKERYRATIRSYLKISRIEGLAPYVRQAQISVTYMPVNGRPDGVVSEDWVLTNYNFDRARRLLAKVPDLDGDGPFIVATPWPLSVSAQVAKPYFRIDLTKVEPRIIGAWINYFLDQTSHEQYGVPIATEQKTTIFRMTVVQKGSRKRPLLRSPKHLRRDHRISRDLDS